MVEIKLHRIYRGAPHSVKLKSDISLRDAIISIERTQNVSRWSSILTEETIKPDYLVLVNKKSTRDLETILKEGNTVSISVLVGGG